MSSTRTDLAVTILAMLFASACGGPQVTNLPAVATSAQQLTPHTTWQPTTSPLPAQTPAATETAAPTPAATLSTPLTRVPTAVSTPTSSGSVPLAEMSIGDYKVRLWQPALGAGLYNHATISREGQPEVRIEAVAAIHDLPSDLTGDGIPDIWFETYAGGSHCCWGTVVYNLGSVPAKVLEIVSEPYYYGTGSGTFHDLDGDGSFEFITRDPLRGIPCSGPTAKVVLQYMPGQGYVGASPRFAFVYADDIAALTRRAEGEVELSRDGYKCGVYEVIVDYLYSGQVDRAWQELQRLYLGPDLKEFRAQLEQAVQQGRFYVPATTVQPSRWNLYADDEVGFAFEYLACYDEEPMRSWGCGLNRQTLEDGRTQITFGSENRLTLSLAGNLSLGDYADQLMQQLGSNQYAHRDDVRLSQHNPPGIVIETIVMHHGVTYALFQRGDTRYTFSSWLSLACSAPDQGITNPDPFWHAVESFRLPH